MLSVLSVLMQERGNTGTGAERQEWLAIRMPGEAATRAISCCFSDASLSFKRCF